MDHPVLTPTQERILGQLRREPTPLVFDPEAIAALAARAREAFDDLSVRLEGERLFVGKSMLSSIHGCEARYLGPDDFVWTPASARGFVAHKAIELRTNWRGEPTPAELVDDAIARLSEQENTKGDWLAGLSDGDLAELRGYALERVTRFVQDFPPLDLRAEPILEATTRWSATTCITLGGKTDLVLGKPEGRISKRLIVDFKTGYRSHHHRADLQFYALVETFARQVPPRKLVTYYLDEAQVEVEDVTLPMLDAALDRTIAGVERHVELTVERRPPVLRPSGACRWCPLRTTCADGIAHLAALADDGSSQGFDDE